MRKLLFDGAVQVEMQGESVLRLINRFADHAEYQIIGYEDQPVRIYDYRSIGLQAIDYVLSTEKLDRFAGDFNQSAQARIWKVGNNGLKVELYDTSQSTPRYMLWVAIGIEDSIPVFDYLLYTIKPLEGDKYALVSLYQRPTFQTTHFSTSLVDCQT